MRKTILIIFAFIMFPLPTLAVETGRISVTAPTTLIGTIERRPLPKTSVVLTWQGMKGANYIIEKINPNGTIEKFSLMSNLSDPNCEIAGGIFRDSNVEKGKTYTYEIRSFLVANRLSAPAVITVAVTGTDLVGCIGVGPVSYRPNLKNLSLNIDFARSEDGTSYDVYVDGKRRSRATTASTVWPVIGSRHTIEVRLADKSSHIVSTAKACDGQEMTSKFVAEKDYTDNIIGQASEYVDNLLENIFNRLRQY